MAAAPTHETLQFWHTPSYSDDALHICPMYWLAEHPSPLLSVQGTHEAVSLELLQVHWFTSMWRGLHVVKLHGAHCVASTLVVPSRNPTCHDVVVHGSGRYKHSTSHAKFAHLVLPWLS